MQSSLRCPSMGNNEFHQVAIWQALCGCTAVELQLLVLKCLGFLRLNSAGNCDSCAVYESLSHVLQQRTKA